MAVIVCRDLGKWIGDRELFSQLSFTVHPGERVGLIGPNGTGKSTLLKMLAGLEPVDAGEIVTGKQTRIAYLPQWEALPPEATIETVALAALGADPEPQHEKLGRVARVLGRLGFTDFGQAVGALSGGWQKRLALARQIAREPDLLLLDEPTNHLDLEGVQWLEDHLKSWGVGYLVVTHDRAFLDQAVDRVMELNPVFPNGLIGFVGGYERFMAQREAFLEQEAARRESLANKLRQEEAWAARGAKARTTKQEARKQSLGQLRADMQSVAARARSERRVDLDFEESERKTKRLVVAHNVSKSFGAQTIVSGFDYVLSPGKRVGLLGRNGSGKTTLLRVLGGLDAPDQGTVTIVPDCRIHVFDQHRQILNQDELLRDALVPKGGGGLVQDERLLNVESFARRLRFRSDQLNTPIRRLSGGEQARVLIGQFMLQPADVLLLDEPTNDLDIPTLEILEQSLIEFPGAVVLITHDRALLDRASTTLLGLDGQGVVTEYADYAQWRANAATSRDRGASSKPSAKRTAARAPAKSKTPQLSFKHKHAWEHIETWIEEAEAALAEIEAAAPPTADTQAYEAWCQRLAEAQEQVDSLYAQWAELEEMVRGVERER